MFQCQARPATPGKAATDAQIGSYMVSLVIAHSDCTAQLETLHSHFEANGVKVIHTTDKGE